MCACTHPTGILLQRSCPGKGDERQNEAALLRDLSMTVLHRVGDSHSLSGAGTRSCHGSTFAQQPPGWVLQGLHLSGVCSPVQPCPSLLRHPRLPGELPLLSRQGHRGRVTTWGLARTNVLVVVSASSTSPSAIPHCSYSPSSQMHFSVTPTLCLAQACSHQLVPYTSQCSFSTSHLISFTLSNIYSIICSNNLCWNVHTCPPSLRVPYLHFSSGMKQVKKLKLWLLLRTLKCSSRGLLETVSPGSHPLCP